MSGSSHVHEVTFTSSHSILVNDLGHNSIYSFEVQSNGLLSDLPTSTATLSVPSSGPRHLVLHPSKRFVYVLNELSNSVTGYFFDVSRNLLSKEFQTISSLRSSETVQDMAAAEIQMSGDGRFVYCSNRDLSSPNLNRSSIAVFEVDGESGWLSVVQHVNTLGQQPRHFNLFNEERVVVVGNLKTNSVITFERNAETGRLEEVPLSEVAIDSPTHIISYNH